MSHALMSYTRAVLSRRCLDPVFRQVLASVTSVDSRGGSGVSPPNPLSSIGNYNAMNMTLTGQHPAGVRRYVNSAEAAQQSGYSYPDDAEEETCCSLWPLGVSACPGSVWVSRVTSGAPGQPSLWYIKVYIVGICTILCMIMMGE